MVNYLLKKKKRVKHVNMHHKYVVPFVSSPEENSPHF